MRRRLLWLLCSRVHTVTQAGRRFGRRPGGRSLGLFASLLLIAVLLHRLKTKQNTCYREEQSYKNSSRTESHLWLSHFIYSCCIEEQPMEEQLKTWKCFPYAFFFFLRITHHSNMIFFLIHFPNNAVLKLPLIPWKSSKNCQTLTSLFNMRDDFINSDP